MNVALKKDEVVDSVGLALSKFDTEALRAVAEHAEEISPSDKGGWLGQVIREYVSVWR